MFLEFHLCSHESVNPEETNIAEGVSPGAGVGVLHYKQATQWRIGNSQMQNNIYLRWMPCLFILVLYDSVASPL